MKVQNKFIYICYILHTLYKTIHTYEDGCQAVKHDNDNKYYMYYKYTFNNTQLNLTTLSNVFIQIEPLTNIYHNFTNCNNSITNDMFTVDCFIDEMGSYNTYGDLYVIHNHTRIQTYKNSYIYSCYPDHDIKQANITHIGSESATMSWKTNYWDNEYYITITNFHVNEKVVKQSKNYGQCSLSTGCTYNFTDLNPCTHYNLTIENVFDSMRNSITVKTIKTICTTTTKSKGRIKHLYRYISIAGGLVIVLVILVFLYRYYNKKHKRMNEEAKDLESEETKILDDRELNLKQPPPVPVYQQEHNYDHLLISNNDSTHELTVNMTVHIN